MVSGSPQLPPQLPPQPTAETGKACNGSNCGELEASTCRCEDEEAAPHFARSTIAKQEISYIDNLKAKPVTGDIELF